MPTPVRDLRLPVTGEATTTADLGVSGRAAGEPVTNEGAPGLRAQVVAAWLPARGLYVDGIRRLRSPVGLNRDLVLAGVFSMLMMLDASITVIMVRGGSTFTEANPFASWGQAHLTMMGYNFAMSGLEMVMVIPLLIGRVEQHNAVSRTLWLAAWCAMLGKLYIDVHNIILGLGVPTHF